MALGNMLSNGKARFKASRISFKYKCKVGVVAFCDTEKCFLSDVRSLYDYQYTGTFVLKSTSSVMFE